MTAITKIFFIWGISWQRGRKGTKSGRERQRQTENLKVQLQKRKKGFSEKEAAKKGRNI